MLTFVSYFRQLYKFILFFLSYLKTIISEQLIHRRIKRTIQKVPIYILHSLWIASPVINVCDKSDTLVTTNESTLTQHHHPKSIVNIWVHSWYCTFYVFGQIHCFKRSLPLEFIHFFIFFLNVDVQFFHPHLLKRLPLFHCVAFAPLLNISCWYVWVPVLELCSIDVFVSSFIITILF